MNKNGYGTKNIIIYTPKVIFNTQATHIHNLNTIEYIIPSILGLH